MGARGALGQAIADKVRLHKQQTKGVTTMCRIFEEYGDERVAARNIEFAEKLLRQNKLSAEEIADAADVPLEQVQALAERLRVAVLA